MKERARSDRWNRWMSASVRWHVAGSVLSTLLCLASVHVYLQDAAVTSSAQLQKFSPDEAIQVLRQAGSWEAARRETQQAHQSNLARVQSLAAWLSPTVDLKDLNHQVRELAVLSGARLLSLDSEGTTSGTRVGVTLCTCRVEGNFESICRLLDGLAHMERPIWCDRVRLHRVIAADDAAAAETVEAVISLRVPHAAEGTLAGRLLALGGPDER